MTEETQIIPAGVLRRRFKNHHLSVSRLKLYENCPRAFELRYIREAPTEGSVATDFGTCLHNVLERLLKWVVTEEYSGRLPEDRIRDYYLEEWSRLGLVGSDVYQEGLSILRQYVRLHPTVNHLDILGVEVEFNLQIGEFVLNGRIDRVDRVDDETIAIVDYKSNRILFSKEEVETDLQMSAYGLAAGELYPWAKNVVFRFHMLRHQQEIETTRSVEDLSDARDYLISLGRLTETAETFPAKLNGYCGYCDHRKSCTAYQTAIEEGDPVVTVTPEAIEDVARAYNKLAIIEKLAKTKKYELGAILSERLAGKTEMTLAGTVFKMIQRTNETIVPTASTVERLVALGMPWQEVVAAICTADSKRLYAFFESPAFLRVEASKRLVTKAEIESDIVRIMGKPFLVTTVLKGNSKKLPEGSPEVERTPVPELSQEEVEKLTPKKTRALWECPCGFKGAGRAIPAHRAVCDKAPPPQAKPTKATT
jgi:putative RecB family exonuclease